MKAAEPREFWIYQNMRDHITECFSDTLKWHQSFIDDKLEYSPEVIHLVEYSAIQELSAQVEEMREALEFYAANSTWLTSKTENHAEHFGDLISVVDLEEDSPITKRKFVGGKRARAIIAKYPVGGDKI